MKKNNTFIDPISDIEYAMESGMDRLEKFINSVFVKLEREGKKRVVIKEKTKAQKEEVAFVYSSDEFTKAEQKGIVKHYEKLRLAHENENIKSERLNKLALIRAKQNNKDRER